MPSILPPSLRPGDTIAIISTARAIAVEELRDGIALAERWGLKVKLGAGVRTQALPEGFGPHSAALLLHCHGANFGPWRIPQIC
jgi:hypothetical protein